MTFLTVAGWLESRTFRVQTTFCELIAINKKVARPSAYTVRACERLFGSAHTDLSRTDRPLELDFRVQRPETLRVRTLYNFGPSAYAGKRLP